MIIKIVILVYINGDDDAECIDRSLLKAIIKIFFSQTVLTLMLLYGKINK